MIHDSRNFRSNNTNVIRPRHSRTFFAIHLGGTCPGDIHVLRAVVLRSNLEGDFSRTCLIIRQVTLCFESEEVITRLHSNSAVCCNRDTYLRHRLTLRILVIENNTRTRWGGHLHLCQIVGSLMLCSTNTIINPITVFTCFRINRNILIVGFFHIIHIRNVAILRHTNLLLPGIRILHAPNINGNLPTHTISDFYCIIKSFNECRRFSNTVNNNIV